MIALAFVASLAAGVSVIALLRTRTTTGPGLLGFAFFLGVIVLALWTHLLLFLRIPVNAWTLLLAPLLLGGAAAWKGDRSVLAVDWKARSPWAVPIILAALFAVGGALSWSLLGFDPEIFYEIKARSIVHYGTLANPDFADPARIHMAARRPLLLPSIFADFYLLAGTFDHRALRYWFAFLHIASLGVLYERAKPHLAWLAVFAWLPALWRDAGGVFTGYPDATLAALLFLAFDAFRTREHGLAVLSLCAAVLLKNDAWPFLLVLALATAVTRPRELGRLALVAAGPLLLIGAWLLASRSFPATVDNLSYAESARLATTHERVPLALARLGSELVKPKHWGLFWIVGLGGVLLRIRRLDREDVRWLLVVFLQLLVYVAAWAALFSAPDVIATSRVQGMRLALHVTPLLWAWLAFRWRETNQPG